jgi:hypothetical protein
MSGHQGGLGIIVSPGMVPSVLLKTIYSGGQV